MAFISKPVMGEGRREELECSECPFVTDVNGLLQNIPHLTRLNISMSGFKDVEMESGTIQELNVLHLDALDLTRISHCHN